MGCACGTCAACLYDSGSASADFWREHAGAVCSRLSVAVEERGRWMRRCRELEQRLAIYALSEFFGALGVHLRQADREARFARLLGEAAAERSEEELLAELRRHPEFFCDLTERERE